MQRMQRVFQNPCKPEWRQCRRRLMQDPLNGLALHTGLTLRITLLADLVRQTPTS